MKIFSSIQKIANAADTLKNFGVPEDAHLNKFASKTLVYGYNGAGKTTISRIFSYIGSGNRPEGLGENFDFELVLEDGTTLTRTSDLSPYASRVLVYNEDYIERNFAWNTGTAQPIFGLGEQNIADVNKLNSARQKRQDLSTELTQAKQEQQAAKRRFDTFSRDTARTIEQRVYQGRSFNAAKLKSRYQSERFGSKHILPEDQLNQAEQILGQQAPRKLPNIKTPIPSLETQINKLPLLLAKTGHQIKLSELEAHPSMESWVKEGHEYHSEHKLGDCLLCGQQLTEERYEALAAHFSDQINQIYREASTLNASIAETREAIQTLTGSCPSSDQLAPPQEAEYSDALGKLGPTRAMLETQLQAFEELIARKLAEPASAIEDDGLQSRIRNCSETYERYTELIAKKGKLIEEHNRFVDDFDRERERAREHIAQHLLATNHQAFSEHMTALENADNTLAILEREVAATNTEIEAREAALREHASAAPELNKEIEAFLRHSGISLIAVEEGYQLRRADGSLVNRLSEGEKTAITFCYFITAIESENRRIKDTIVVVDDPISSLDTRALTYMAALIRDRLADAKQLFVFTHNAPFMSEMRKWMYSRSMMQRAKQAAAEGGDAPNIPLFYLNLRFDYETKRRWSTLENMNRLIRDYEGEYHYLYCLVYHYAKQANPTSELFLLLPNAIRKVMETYLLFKLPGNNNFSGAIDQMANSVPDKPKFYALRKFAEMEGHGEDLSAITQPATLTIEEAHPAAQELIALIAATDKTHSDEMKKLCEKNPVS